MWGKAATTRPVYSGEWHSVPGTTEASTVGVGKSPKAEGNGGHSKTPHWASVSGLGSEVRGRMSGEQAAPPYAQAHVHTQREV